MYANQQVRILGKRVTRFGHHHDQVLETLHAHRVEISRTGRIRVHLDDPDGPDWNYANPAGVRDLPLGTRVEIVTSF